MKVGDYVYCHETGLGFSPYIGKIVVIYDTPLQPRYSVKVIYSLTDFDSRSFVDDAIYRWAKKRSWSVESGNVKPATKEQINRALLLELKA